MITEHLKDLYNDPYVGKIFPSKKYGDFIVTRNLGIINRRTRYEVKFLNSNGINITIEYHIREGDIGDPRCGINVDIPQFSNNYGQFMILEWHPTPKGPEATIQFTTTGTILTNIPFYSIRAGNIADPNLPYKIPLNINTLQPSLREIRINSQLNNIRCGMISRCININDKNYVNYGNIGVKICDRWLKSAQNFYEDARLLPQFNKFYTYPTLYTLDKDYLQLNISKENRIYSPSTCMFLHMKDNVNVMHYEKFKDSNKKYYGVHKVSGGYIAQFYINDTPITFGLYESEFTAAQVYNCAYKFYHQYDVFPLLNNVPDIDPTTIASLNLKPKLMCSPA